MIDAAPLELVCDCPEDCGTFMWLTNGILSIQDGDGQVCSIDIPEWLEDAMLKAYQDHEEAPSLLDHALHNPAIICTDCGKPSPAGLFYVGDRQLCGPCAEKYM